MAVSIFHPLIKLQRVHLALSRSNDNVLEQHVQNTVVQQAKRFLLDDEGFIVTNYAFKIFRAQTSLSVVAK